MTVGISLYSDITALVPSITNDSMAVARMANVLLPTVTALSADGLMARTITAYGTGVTFAEASEDDDTSPQKFNPSSLGTLTPAIYRARVDISDAKAASDFNGSIADATLELGSAAGAHVESKIASYFSSLTGGTIGTAGTPITWRHVTKGLALLMNQGVPRGAPVFCALHPYQWEILLSSNSVAAATVAVAPGFQDRLVSGANFFTIPQFVGVTFVITNGIPVNGSDDAYGAIYVPQAIAVDTRKPMDVRPQRDESRELSELNSSMWYAAGVNRPKFGVQILSDCTAPS